MSIYGYRIKLTIISAFYPTITIPVSSVSARLRSGTPTYLQVTIPDYDTYAYPLSLRAADADMYVYKKIIGTGIWRLITWVDVENVYSYVGSTSKSIVLVGHRTYTNVVPTSIYLNDYNYIGVTTRTIIRCGINNNPEPGDRVVAGSYADIVSDQITYTINNRQATIEISGT